LIGSIFEVVELLVTLVGTVGTSSEEVWYDRERQNFMDPDDNFVGAVAFETDSLILTKRFVIIL
jgi:hypothetical protein